jgi:hypothetical protein
VPGVQGRVHSDVRGLAVTAEHRIADFRVKCDESPRKPGEQALKEYKLVHTIVGYKGPVSFDSGLLLGHTCDCGAEYCAAPGVDKCPICAEGG